MHHENQYLYFSVSDLDIARSRIEEAGGRNLTEIEDMPWGERMFYALDPLGSRISFVEQSTMFTGSR
jgi:predicted enzyme related to lactoylglutathione lyase